MSLVEELVRRNNELTQRNIDAIKNNTDVIQKLLGMPPPSQIRHDMSFSSRDINVTSSHTDYEINVVRPCHFIQVWCDGVTDGISIRLHSTSNPSYPLNKFIILPVNNPEKIYFTNDVRAGRSSLTLYFVHAQVPLTMYLGGEPAEVSRSELAARLGSITTYDRRGEIIWWDDFEDNLNKWTVTTVGALSTVTLSTTYCVYGSKCCKFYTDNTINDYGSIQRTLPYPRLTKYGFEFSSIISDDDNTLLLSAAVYDGTTLYHYSVRYDEGAETLEYRSNLTPTWQTLDTGVSPYRTAPLFHKVKLVIDLPNGRYSRFLLDNTEYDMSNYSCQSSASAINPAISVALTVTTNAAANVTSYIDSLIVTQNEP